MDITDSIDQLTERIIGCAIAVHTALGPGLLESIYYDCLVIELLASGLRVERDRGVPVLYRGQRVRHDLRLDLVVEGCVIIEIKAIERLHPLHQAQLITYLKLTGLPAGLLLNFNATTLRAGLKRVDHPDRYLARHARA
jgi:GxxExxY protein